MVAMNPDFSRRADENVKPPNPQFGWTDGTVTLDQAHYLEQVGRERLENDMPIVCRTRIVAAPLPEIEKQWKQFQKDKGRYEGSADWTLLDEFVIKKVLIWLPQIIGSCVMSNTFRGWVIRLMYQIGFLGMPQEYLGRNEFGSINYSFYGPYNYGAARKRANMRGGDGLYCEAMAESLVKDGVVACNTPKLLEILKKLGADREKDFPEPQNASVYRSFGNWNYIDDLRQYADFPLENCPSVKSVDELREHLKAGSPCFQCSGLAVKKVGTHKDGFAVHARNPSDSWSHNMCWHGVFYASDGKEYFVLSNESWGLGYVYNIPTEEVEDWFRRRNITVAAIGNIRGPQSAPPAIA